jgi:cellulose synthase (UDP-forming)
MTNDRNVYVFATSIAGILLIVFYPTFETLAQTNDSHLFGLMIVFRLALFFVIFHSLGYWFYRLIPKKKGRISSTNSKECSTPNIAILIPIRNEPIQIIKRMLISLKQIRHPNVEFVIIDNSTPTQAAEFHNISQEINFSFSIVRKEDTNGFKAGALNRALSTLDKETEYILVLDADHAPQPDILDKLAPILQKNPSAAFIQAPQRYHENGVSLIEGAYCYKQRIFYDHVCRGLSENGTLFFSGTNALFRKEALDDIGGFDESSLTEDLRSSVKLHTEKWYGIYYPEDVALGVPPSDIGSYYRQQRRWAIGTYQNLQARTQGSICDAIMSNIISSENGPRLSE